MVQLEKNYDFDSTLNSVMLAYVKVLSIFGIYLTILLLTSSCSSVQVTSQISPGFTDKKHAESFISNRQFITDTQRKLKELFGTNVQGNLFYQSDVIYGDTRKEINLWSVKDQTILVAVACDGPGTIRYGYEVNDKTGYFWDDPQYCGPKANWILSEFEPVVDDIKIALNFDLSKSAHRLRFIIGKKE